MRFFKGQLRPERFTFVWNIFMNVVHVMVQLIIETFNTKNWFQVYPNETIELVFVLKSNDENI